MHLKLRKIKESKVGIWITGYLNTIMCSLEDQYPL